MISKRASRDFVCEPPIPPKNVLAPYPPKITTSQIERASTALGTTEAPSTLTRESGLARIASESPFMAISTGAVRAE